MQLLRTDSSNNDFKNLVRELDSDLAKRDGDDHAFFAAFNKIDAIRHVVVAYEEGQPISCGAIKQYAPETMEIKRMYTIPSHRGKGIASLVLQELEKWATELKNSKCILETGKKQPEAIQLYLKNNFSVIQNYGQYTAVESSVCFEKRLSN